MIFLDLGMPIKDGYEACEQIINHYNKRVGEIDTASVWLSDLKEILDLYIGNKNEII